MRYGRDWSANGGLVRTQETSTRTENEAINLQRRSEWVLHDGNGWMDVLCRPLSQ